jgi:hypothetical protein
MKSETTFTSEHYEKKRKNEERKTGERKAIRQTEKKH